MGSFAFVGFGAYVVVSLSVGLRLLLVARQSRQVPELAIGGALFAGGLGYCLFVLASTPAVSPGGARAVYLAGIGLLEIGTVALYLGVWRIFRLGTRWAAGLFTLASAGMALHFVMSVYSYTPSSHRPPLVFWLFSSLAAMGYLWSAFESFRYHVLLRRRVRLQLAEPEMAMRFLLWGCAGSAALSMIGLAMLNRFVAETGVDPRVMLAQSFCGLASGISIWFAFFPPAAFLRVVLARKT